MVGVYSHSAAFAADATDSSPRKEVRPTLVQFTIVFDSAIESQSARQGELVEAHLKEKLRFNGNIIAPANSFVLGHIELIQIQNKNKKQLPTKLIRVVLDELMM